MQPYDARKYADIAEQLEQKIEDFLLHFTQYPTDVEVGIHEETHDIVLDSPAKIPTGYLQFSIADFIKTNEKGLYEADEKVIYG